MLDIQSIARALGGEVSGHSARVPGPGHSPKDRSLSITLTDNADGFLCHSFAQDDAIVCKDYVRSRLGLPAFKPNGLAKKAGPEIDISSTLNGVDWLRQFNKKASEQQQSFNGKVVATYDYKDAGGNLLYQNCKLEPKDFRQRRPDGKGGWDWSLAGLQGRRVLYRLPELLSFPDATVFVTEGEKDADNVIKLGYCATTVASHKWTDDCLQALAGRDCWIIEDNDEPGLKMANEAAMKLHGIAKSVRVVSLPDLGPRLPRNGKDISDWLDQGHTGAELEEICYSTPLWDPAKAPILQPSSENAAEDAAAIGLDDFYAYMPMHNYIFAPTCDTWPASSVNARIPPIGKTPAATWLDENKPVELMTWLPGEAMIIRNRFIADGGFIARNGITCFNLYRPPALKRGDPDMAGPWIEHVRLVYPDDAEHLIKWLAHRVQRAHEKINHALVLGGAQGIGKDTALEPVKRAIGPWNFAEVSPQHMLGRFNGYLKSVILRVSEARDSGEFDRYEFYDHSKSYIASPPDVLRVDEKNIREYTIPNVSGVIITTNHKTNGIFLPADDRRHYVAWSDLSRDSFELEYWNMLWRWYNAGGDGHVAAYLAQLDISGFDAKAPPPKTQAFWEIVGASRAPEDDEMQDAIDALGNPDALTLSQVVTHAEADFALFLRERKNARLIPHRLEACGYVAVRNSGSKDGRYKVGGRHQTVYGKAALSIRDRIAAADALAARER